MIGLCFAYFNQTVLLDQSLCSHLSIILLFFCHTSTNTHYTRYYMLYVYLDLALPLSQDTNL